MRKYQKAAVVMAMLGSVSFLGAGVSHAGDEPSAELNNKQTNACSQSNTTQGLINISDVNLALSILGFNSIEDKETESVSCTNGLALGAED
ncbi:hypothetical protein HTV80_01300 [Streptomyces sp. Vc74B-19]|uniref:hypothetical protein n=1 Tax=unclassified Streptomyces TaxID=2593676 RepID=UPI001BFC7AC8|nr:MULTISPECIES: hypothetical protein [unclassified Streptomyces]MBT3161750.1 hypothetical protein [Streptomyces sp. Vc74B-19]MCO4694077.1 hypothetical protein [Streptomyces sp. RO-S4]MDU0304287.1 hypothetical protein [Streptomyces sp. PAL114]